MTIRLNPIEALKYWRTLRSEKQDRVVEYLQTLASEAKELALVWNKIADDLDKGISPPDLAVPNPCYLTVRFDYRSLSGIVGKHLPDSIRNQLTNSLATALVRRDEIRGLIEEISGRRVVATPEQSEVVLKASLQQALSALMEEVATIDGLVRRFSTLRS